MSLFGFVVTASYIWVGVLRREHVPPGVLAIIPSVLGMWLGNVSGRRLGVGTFRRIVLVIPGLLAALMIRRALT